MQQSKQTETRRGLWLSLFVLGLVTAVAIVPTQFDWEVSGEGKESGLFQRTESHEPGLENYDIREQKSEETAELLTRFRNSSGKTAASIADVRDGFARGEEDLRTRVPSLKIEYNQDIRIPEVITPDVWKADIERLSGPTSAKRSDVLRNFAKQNNSLIGMEQGQIDQLKVIADYENPTGNMGFAHLEQLINGVPVFRGEIKAGFTKNGEMVRVINNLAPGLDYDSLSTNFRDPSSAVKAATRHINVDEGKLDLRMNEAASTEIKSVFGTGDWATTAEKMYFPTEPGVAVPAWRVLVWLPVNAYYVIVDAETGAMLWRKNVTEDQTAAATYSVYNNPNSYIKVADSPAPLSPGPIDPTLGTQGALATRTNVTLIGNEAPYTFNNNGWMTDGTNFTDGNFNEAGVDRVAPNGVDAPMAGDATCPGVGCRTLTSTWNPPPGSPAPGDDPLSAQAQRGAVIQMFYVMNRYQSEMYRLGFTEQAFNFQGDNFGRGGVGADRVSSEGQDSSGTNNANFSTVADGGRGRMQMFLWTGPTPDYDGTPDAEVIIHEVTHGLSNRLHGNASGLSTNMARGMGEGWSDFYAYTMLAEPTDPVNGIYTTGGYATYLAATGFTGNYYYGIRRFPRAPIAFLGPNGKPHSPFTFRHINSTCNTEIGTTTTIGTISAFPRGPFGVTQCDSVHNAGEVWSSALWETRNIMVTRLGFQTGTQRILQVVTDGMKLAPLGPTFLQERDAIIAAAASVPANAADVVDIREGFRRRGMGFSAAVIAASPANVTEAFDFPNIQVVNPFTVSDTTGDNDGFPEPGEAISLTVSITNTTGAAINNVQANVTGGGSANLGTVNNGQTVQANLSYTVPANATCGAMHDVTINASSTVGAQSPVVRSFRLGAPVGGAPATFTNNTAITIGPDAGVSVPYGTTVNVAGLSGNKTIKLELTGVTHTFPSDIDMLLVGPAGQKYIVLSDSGSSGDVSALTFTLADGAAALPPTQWAAGEYRPHNIGANDGFAAPAPAAPYTNAAPAGSDTLNSVFGSNGTTMNGTWTLYAVDDAGIDGGSMAGWKLTFEANDYACSIANRARADWDGDGKSDMSVFRPSEGNWYVMRSTDGLLVMKWGTAGDTLVPGDYDNDGKADWAVFRANADQSQPDYYVLNSNGFTYSGASWGTTGDVAIAGDYDGDGRTDRAVFRPSNSTWFINYATGTAASFQFGAAGDVPFAMDQDGDGKTNLAVWRPSNTTFYIARNTGVPSQNFDTVPFGLAGDQIATADYDGDNKDDVAVFRPSNGTWYIRRSSNGALDIIPFGANGDIAVPGDYNGDGADDVTVYRNGQWWFRQANGSATVQSFGISTDTPLPARYIR